MNRGPFGFVSNALTTETPSHWACFAKKTCNKHVLRNLAGRLYVGAVNRLYELSPTLDPLRHVVTGPYPDNPMCPPPPEECRCTVISCQGKTDLRPIDGVTKTLLIDYSARQLIHCTNLFQVSTETTQTPLVADLLRICSTTRRLGQTARTHPRKVKGPNQQTMTS